MVFGVSVLFQFGSFLYMVWKLSDPIEQKTEEEGGPVHCPPWPMEARARSRGPPAPGLGPRSSHHPAVGLGVSAGQEAAAQAGPGRSRPVQAGPGWSSPLTRAPCSGCRPKPGAGIGWCGCWDHRGPGDRRGREGGPPGPGCLSEGSDLCWCGGEGRSPLSVCLGGSGPWEAPGQLPRCGLRTLSQDLKGLLLLPPLPHRGAERAWPWDPAPPPSGPSQREPGGPTVFLTALPEGRGLGKTGGGASPTWPSMCLPSRRLWWLPERG